MNGAIQSQPLQVMAEIYSERCSNSTRLTISNKYKKKKIQISKLSSNSLSLEVEVLSIAGRIESN